MRRTSAYSISILLIFFSVSFPAGAQDTINLPLKIRIGVDVLGPALYLVDNNVLNTEANISVDIDKRKSLMIGGGYSDYSYSQYNYEYSNKGIFIRAGVDFNLMNLKKSKGNYWGGIGIRYGLSRYNYEYPTFQQENYWGTTVSSIPLTNSWAHFIEISPGVRTEVFKNFSMGWTMNLRFLLKYGTGKDLRPIYVPGFGNAQKTFSPGITYFLAWNIPYKKIRVIIEKEVPEETDQPEGTGTNSKNQQGSGIRQ